MRTRGTIALATAATLAAAGLLALGVPRWDAAHVRRVTGRTDLGRVSCLNCHFVSTARLPWAKERPRHPAPAGLAVSPDSRRLYIALDELDEVWEADVTTRQVVRKARVAGAPTGLALAPDGGRLFVTCRNADALAVLDLRSFTEVDRVSVGVAPVGVARLETTTGARLVVANSGSDDISVLAAGLPAGRPAPLRELARLAAGREPYAVAPGADGQRALVANRLAALVRHPDEVPAAELTVVDAAQARVVARERLESAHLSEGVAAVPGRPWALAPLVRVRNLVPITQVAQGWVMSSGLALVDAREGGVVQVPLDEVNDYFADPAGVVVDPAGRRAFVVSGGSDVVSVVDLERLAGWLAKADEVTRRDAIDDLQLSAEYVLARIPTGRNPRQATLSPDGRTLFVAERLDDAVLLIDTASTQPVGRIALGDGGRHDPVRRGERVFTRAASTFQRQFSCRSCHPDGHVDGLAYDFDADGLGRNLVDNRTLQGIAATRPFKWNGKNPTLAEQCGPRFARVLTRVDPFSERELADLTAFLESLPPPRTRPKSETRLTPAQERGRALFFAARTSDGRKIPRALQCQTCHPPPLYSNRLPAPVGTRGDGDSTDSFDTPHLLGIGASAPYLHDGRAATLEEIWTVHNPQDLHGVTSHLTKHELNDLIEFLKTL
jgi:DNA-binding beta-propeller fold protein YncE